MSTYQQELNKAMLLLAAQPNAIFVGQSVVYGGQAMFSSFEGIPNEQRIEFPVAEDLQMGFCTGLALGGFLPVSVYPRMDFLLLAFNQLVNHLDKFSQLAGIKPKVIIRTAVGAKKPMYAGPQHSQDHTDALREMTTNDVEVYTLPYKEAIVPMYQQALKHDGSLVIVEYAELYNT